MKSEAFKKYFLENKFEIDYDRVSLFICRNDGVMLYSFGADDKKDAASIGALLAGVWQAANALSSFIPKKQNEFDYRLGFDSSSDGVYLLPLKVNDSTFYLGCIYNSLHNPAVLKNTMRKMAVTMSDFIAQNLNQVEKSDNEKNEYLFDEISNDEIDNLFSFVGEM